MNKLTLSLTLLLLSINVHALTLTSTVDRTSIGLNETLILTITLDKQDGDTIDFSRVEIQFDILNRQRSSQTSIINGRITAKTEWNLILAPKEAGTLVIPSFSVGGVFSDAITITVTDNSPANTAGEKTNSEVFLESSIDKSTVYVQEQLLFTLRLYYRTSLSGYTPDNLSITGATTELVAENNFTTNYQAIRYNVLEKVYAIHPQSSGTMDIPAQSWQVEKSIRGFSFGQITNPYLRIRSQALQVEVKPVPKVSTAKQWLPASRLSLEQQWQQSTITAKVGEPLTYSLLLKAHGLNYSQLPSLALSSNEEFTIYSDLPQVENSKNMQGIIGSRTENYAVIPKKPGTFMLPEISLRWWNVTSNKEELIVLPRQQVIVANSEIFKEPLPSSPNKISGLPSPVIVNDNTLMYWQISSLLFACLSIIFLVLWQRQPNNPKQQTVVDTSEQKKRSNAHIKKSMVDIEQAIKQQQWRVLKTHLLQWASLVTQQPIKNSGDLIHYFPDLEEALSILDKQLYSESNVVIWDFKEMLPLLKQQHHNQQKVADKKPLLKVLYTN
ncbi:hypothetical protein AB835_08950 [Candidatus Endobugula sertula]|uniref:DUF7939 domain-containing protein n=1 Tax=Candidatus Endobugula sertula TaxID=62101 RepID=A0A1D2QPF3_9GAMM|nr:hypothetical protein AB835_08950 [Candidatus Endobugula sertula]